MKLLLALVPLLALVAGSFALETPAFAAPNAKVTLTAGQTEVVSRNGCTLQVKKDSAELVVVKCNPTTVTASAEAVDAHTLNAGQKLKIQADGCALEVTKNKPGKVKVRCQAILDEIVTVGPGGAWSFSAATVNITAGETVGWVWDSDDHTVTSGDGTADGLFCSPNDQNCDTAASSTTGATYQHTFAAAGTFQYFCRIHEGMTGTVNVTAP